MLTAFLDNVQEAGTISPRRLGLRLHMPVAQLAKIARLHRNSLGRRKITPATQERLGEIASIIAKATGVAGDEAKAIIWFKHQPIPGFRGETAVGRDGVVDVGEDAADCLEIGRPQFRQRLHPGVTDAVARTTCRLPARTTTRSDRALRPVWRRQ